MRHLRGIQSTCACQGVGFDQRLILSTRAFFREAFKVMMRILWESSGDLAFCSSKHLWNFLKKHIVGLQVVFKNESSVFSETSSWNPINLCVSGCWFWPAFDSFHKGIL